MRSSAGDTLSQLCVWHVLPRTALPLVPPLPSIASAAAETALFGDFTGTMGESDFPWPYIIGLRVRPCRCGPPGTDFRERPARGAPGSRTSGFHACERSQTTQGRLGLALAPQPVLPSAYLHSVGTLDGKLFAAQYSARV